MVTSGSLVGYLFLYFGWLRFRNLLPRGASAWISSTFWSVNEIGGIKVLLKDALPSTLPGKIKEKKKKVSSSFGLWCLRDLVIFSQSSINWYDGQETWRCKAQCTHKALCISVAGTWSSYWDNIPVWGKTEHSKSLPRQNAHWLQGIVFPREWLCKEGQD